MQKKENILILGASPNPNRTSYLAAKLLLGKGYQLKAIGNKKGKIDSISLETEIGNSMENIDAVTVFLKPERQKIYYDLILGLQPKTLIFNPGTENPELEELAKSRNIKIVSCCTIALMAVGML